MAKAARLPRHWERVETKGLREAAVGNECDQLQAFLLEKPGPELVAVADSTSQVLSGRSER